MHISYFSIFYSTTFTVLAFILAVLLLISPGDGIYQAYNSGRLGQILSIAGVYILTLIVALLIYSTRLYTSKSHLSSIPKSWIPIRKGDLSKSVRRMIVESLQRSTTIAYDTHPKDLRQEQHPGLTDEAASRPATAASQVSNHSPPIWGTISHPGWSAPSSPDLPNLQFLLVILELPHIIEAKAVSLAPPDPFYSPPATPSPASPTPQSIPDTLAVSILQRPAPMGLRDYILHLTSLSLIVPPSLGPEFLTRYERARFSDLPLTEAEFRALMSIFAEILRGMTALDSAIVEELHAQEEDEYGSESGTESSVEAQSFSTTGTVERTPYHTPMPYAGGFESPGLRREVSDGSLAGSEGTVRTAPSRARRMRDPSGGTGTGSGRSRRQTIEALRMTSTSSAKRAQRRKSSVSSAKSGGSVIRLAEARGPLDLPYVIRGTGGYDEDDEEI